MGKQVDMQTIIKATGISQQALSKRAKKEEWLFTEIVGSGRPKKMYETDSISEKIRQPVEKYFNNENFKEATKQINKESAQRAGISEKEQRLMDFDEFLAKEKAEEAEKKAKRLAKKSMSKYSRLPKNHKQRKRADARKVILTLEEAHRCHNFDGKHIEAARADFCDKIMNKEITLPDWVWEYMPLYRGAKTVNKESVQRWGDDYRNKGIDGLIADYGKRKGTGMIDKNSEMQYHIIKSIIDTPHITDGKLRTYLEAIFKDTDTRIPSKKSINKWVKNWKELHKHEYLRETNPDAWKNKYMTAFGDQTEGISRLNQLWELDSTPGDWIFTDGRFTVVGVIDVYSRRVMLHISKTSKAEAIAQLLRKAILAWGMPETIRIDNGKDYKSQLIMLAAKNLGIDVITCRPFESEGKPFIERFFKTMSHGVLELRPEFIGHNVAQRKQIEGKKSFFERLGDDVIKARISSEEFKPVINQWVEKIYHNTPHTGLDKKTPFQVYSSWTESINWIPGHRKQELDLLLAEIGGERTVVKKGIHLDGNFFISVELGHYAGQRVILRRDESDIGRIYVYLANEGTFIGIAECPKLLGISSQEIAVAAKHSQKKFLSHQKKERKENTKHIKRNADEVITEYLVDKAPNVTSIPGKRKEYTTPAMQEFAKAARADAIVENQPDIIDRQKLIDEIEQKKEAQKASVVDFNDPQAAYRYWMDVKNKIESGEITNEKTKHGCANYIASPECKNMENFFKDFKDFDLSLVK
ncbi:MAG: DDE-type integrase/transposase/recombinase [Pseudomonadota bacterium]